MSTKQENQTLTQTKLDWFLPPKYQPLRLIEGQTLESAMTKKANTMHSIRMSLNERNDYLFGFIVTVQILYTTDYHTLSQFFQNACLSAYFWSTALNVG